jgi:hypothetical protein
MKKRFSLLVVAALVSGCVTATRQGIMDKGIENSYAYVIGKGGGRQHFDFRSSEEANKYFPSHDRAFSARPYYELHKVVPGFYYATSGGDYRSTLSSPGQPLFKVVLEPGKITYIGELYVIISGARSPPPPGMPDVMAGLSQQVSFGKEVRNDSEAAKSYLLKNYPELAGKLDAAFVYRPAQ